MAEQYFEMTSDLLLKARYESTLDKIPLSSGGLLVLAAIYYFCFQDLAAPEFSGLHTAISFFHIVLALARIVLWKSKKSISKSTFVNIFYLLITAGSLAWLYMSYRLANHQADSSQNLESARDFARIHFFVIIGVVNAIPTLFKHAKWPFISNIFILYAAIFFLAPLSFKQPLVIMGGMLLIGLFLIVIIPQYLSNWSVEKEQMEKEYELQQIIDGFPGGVSEIRDGSYRRVNKYLREHIVGALDDQQVGFLNKNDDWIQTIQQFSQSNESKMLIEKTILTKNGLRAFLMALSKLGPDHILIASVDIQDLVDARKESEAQKAQALEKARLASLGLMAAGIAHEINNPLAVIQNRSDLLIQEIKNLQNTDTTKLLNHAEKISPMVQRVNRIIQSMRNLTRDSSKDPLQCHTLQLVLDDVLVLAKEKLQYTSVELAISGDALHESIDCRPGELAQVFINAVNNSVHAIENLDIKWIRIQANKNAAKDHIRIEIVDSGLGISQSIRDKIMTPLFTTKTSNHGTGLGLSLSRKIAQSHGGELFFDHAAVHTTLVMVLPISAIDRKNKSAA